MPWMSGNDYKKKRQQGAPRSSLEKIQNMDKYIEENQDELLKESWVDLNIVLKIPIQVLHDLNKQRVQKRIGSISVKTSAFDQYKLSSLISSSTASSKLLTSSSYLKNVLRLRKNAEGIKSFTDAQTPKNKKVADYMNSSEAMAKIYEKFLPTIYKDESDRQLVMHHEIHMELKSQMLVKFIKEAKQKHASFVGSNTLIMGKVGKLEDEMSSLARIQKQKSQILASNPKMATQQFNQLSYERNRKEFEISQLRTQQSSFKKEIHSNSEELKKIYSEIIELKNELGEVKSMQTAYYHALLYEGTDPRHEGLIWIIKVIWQLGHNVNLSKMPPFIDEKGVVFLFHYARLTINLEEIQRKLRNKIVECRDFRLSEIAIKSPEIISKHFDISSNEFQRRLSKTLATEPISQSNNCLLYTSDAADDTPCVDLGGRRIIKKKKYIK
eukprot:TRINITY_DN4547_c0_g1_i5.p1 TRINITY_DN4547_c0_g1~~TRINITY_DN4547_c0_g1_i5.p1  ORF type:complete len:440 (-),score=74.86 TRINITY_DN4547_c0_g1_i5:75-1394(-)